MVVASVFSVRLRLLLTRDGNGSHRPHEEKSEEERLHTGEPGVLEQTPDLDQQIEAEKSAVKLYLLATCVIMVLIYVNSIVAYFLIKSRRDKLLWAILSYLYALANVSLGASVFLFHCASRRDVRLGWRKAWKNVSVLRVNFGRWRSIWITPKRKGKNDQAQPNAQILLNGENIDLATTRVESDRQSNITLPSSAAMTNDVFVNGRPLSTARASLLDEADIPAKQDDQRSKQGSEVDLSDTGRGDGEQRRSQNSMHSTRRSADGVDAQAVASSENVSDSENPSFLGEVSSAEVHDENNTDISNTDITDGVTSKSESSAPTTVEVSLPQTSTSLDNSNHACPRLLPKLFPRTDTLATPSSSSLSEAPARPRPNVKRKRSSESVNSRNGSGSVGPRARKFPQLQSTYSKSSSSTFGEIAPKVPDIKGQPLNESLNLRTVAPVAGTNGRIQFPKNRYKDGREKPEPKQWTGSLGPRIAYVPVPHVSKIHREPNRNETSV